MAAVSGLGHTRALPQYQNELFNATPTAAKTLAMLGGIGGAGTSHRATDLTWQTTDNNTPAQTGSTEGSVPVYEERDRSPANNVFQQFKYGIQLGYEQMSATGQLAAPGTASDVLVSGGSRGIASELAFQTDMKLKRMARDVNWALIQGAYVRPTDNATARQLRGLLEVTVLAGSTNDDIAAADITQVLFETTLRNMFAAGAEFIDPLIICGAWNKQTLTSIYGLSPRSRDVGGLHVDMIETDILGEAMVMLERDIPADDILIVDMAHLRVEILPIMDKGTVFVEPQPSEGDSEKFMLFGSLSLSYGLPQFHGAINNTSTS